MVKGAHAKNHNYLVDDLDNFNDWSYGPRITRREKKAIVECFFEISTDPPTFQLCFN